MAEVQSDNKCKDCDEEIKQVEKICMTCYNDLKSEKYNEFLFVLAIINNKLKDLYDENKKLKELCGIKENKE